MSDHLIGAASKMANGASRSPGGGGERMTIFEWLAESWPLIGGMGAVAGYVARLEGRHSRLAQEVADMRERSTTDREDINRRLEAIQVDIKRMLAKMQP